MFGIEKSRYRLIIHYDNVIIRTMKRLLLCLLLFLLTFPVFAGSVQDAMKTHDKVFIYLYTKNCGYCVKFNPIYEKVMNKFSNRCKFLKIDAETPYGISVMRDLQGVFVPYVILMDNKEKKLYKLQPNCLLDYACTANAVDVFVNK